MDILPNVAIEIRLQNSMPKKVDDWTFFEWQITLSKGKKVYTFPYHTGTGLLDKTKPRFHKADKFSTVAIDQDRDGLKGPSLHINQLEQLNKKHYNKWDYLLYHPKIPTKMEILQSLAMETVNMLDIPTFDEWCLDFGYDNDSIKAKKIFDNCYEQAAKMKALLTKEEFQTFITTDYDNTEIMDNTDSAIAP